MLQNIDFSYLINVSIGILFSLIIGFFILRAVISAIAFATDYEGKKETLEEAKKSLTAAVKGVVIALGTFIFLNFILSLLGIAPIENPGEYVQERLDSIYVCLYNYSLCGLPGVDIDRLPPNERYEIAPYDLAYFDTAIPTYLSSYDLARDPERLLGPLPPPGSAIRPVIDASGKETVTANYFAVFTYGRATHHTGMTQWGARARATAGQKYQDIIFFYYKSDIHRPDVCNYNLDGNSYSKDMSEVRIEVPGKASNLTIEDYVYGIRGEMPGNFGAEALKAQAIAARSYGLLRSKCGTRAICGSDSCQVYSGKNCSDSPNWCEAVRVTEGMTIKQDMGAGFQYSAYSGGYVYPGGFDLDINKPNPKWPEDANEKISMTANGAGASFYATWIGGGFYKSRDVSTCDSVTSTYLDQETWADFANAHDIYVKKNGKDRADFLKKIRSDGCNLPYSKTQLKDDSPNKHNRVTSIILDRKLLSGYTPNQIAENSSITMITDKGEVVMKVSTFRAIYNLRALGGLNISSNILAFEGR